MRHSTLTGGWSGAYRYPNGNWPETVFNAQIEEVAALLLALSKSPICCVRSLGPWPRLTSMAFART